MAAFYPSCVFDLKLRFDEALHLVYTPTPVSVDGRVLNPARNPGELRTEPLISQRGDQNESFVFGRVPLKASIEKQGYRSAATFSMTVDYREVPIDPRVIRAARIDIHLGTVSAEAFGTGVTRLHPNGQRSSILRTRDDWGNPNLDTLRFTGLVDEWKVSHSDNASSIELKGRDLRGILIDSPLMATALNSAQIIDSLDTAQPVDRVVRQILDHHPMAALFTVSVNAAEWPFETVPSPLLAHAAPRHRRGARGQRTGARTSSPGGNQQMSYWDAIVQHCYLVGAIPHFVGDKLRIRPTRSIFDQQRAGFDLNVPTPFQDGLTRISNGQEFSVRRLLYGRDIKSIDITRKYAGNSKPKIVRCVSYNQSAAARGTQGVVEARWPAADAHTDARTTQSAPGGQQAHEETLNIPISNVADPAQLLEIARNLYEEIGRNEINGTCETKNMASFGGTNADPDMLRLEPGDGVEFYTDTRALNSRAPLVATVVDFERAPIEDLTEQLTRRLGDENLARVVAASSRGAIAEIQRFFRVANVKYEWSGSGVDVNFDFQNYFVVRQPDNSTGNTAAGTVTSTPSNSAATPDSTAADTLLSSIPSGTRGGV